jgi:hypothetical protein
MWIVCLSLVCIWWDPLADVCGGLAGQNILCHVITTYSLGAKDINHCILVLDQGTTKIDQALVCCRQIELNGPRDHAPELAYRRRYGQICQDDGG